MNWMVAKSSVCTANVVCQSCIGCWREIGTHLYEKECFKITNVSVDDIKAVFILLFASNASSHPPLNNSFLWVCLWWMGLLASAILILTLLKALKYFSVTSCQSGPEALHLISPEGILSLKKSQSTQLSWREGQLAWKDVYSPYSLPSYAQVWIGICSHSSLLKKFYTLK